jgi:Copper transport outer membrane protein, MctB
VIDFRYHLVSIVAVFLALAIGIVLGSTELQGTVYSALDHTTSKLQNEADQADTQLKQSQQVVSADGAWIAANESVVLHDMLDGQRVVIFTEPGFQSSVVSGIMTAIKDAGATYTGQVNLAQKFFSTSDSVTASLATINSDMAESSGIQLSSSLADQQQGTAQVLASELLTKASTSSASSIEQVSATQSSSAETALDAYSQAGYLNVSGQPTTTATMAVVVTPQDIPSDGTADPLAQLLGPFAQELAKTTSTVVVGSTDGSVAGSPLSLLRATSASSQVSSVDDADTVLGQVMVMEALYAELSGQSPTSWGTQSSDSFPAINPVSTPAATPSTSSPSTKKTKK